LVQTNKITANILSNGDIPGLFPKVTFILAFHVGQSSIRIPYTQQIRMIILIITTMKDFTPMGTLFVNICYSTQQDYIKRIAQTCLTNKKTRISQKRTRVSRMARARYLFQSSPSPPWDSFWVILLLNYS
jgi:hypothetical protein